MGEPVSISTSCHYNIRGSDYIISLDCNGDDSMTVQVEDRLSTDQWRASFDANYIEDLTHKTGNFKQFNIFVSMLESAISKTSESVCLDLLTYNDLETLRQKKSGVSNTTKSSAPASRPSHITSKRYLILTYTVEFDRIHYPLPLPYIGKVDVLALQEEVHGLRQELRKVRQGNSQSTGTGSNGIENQRSDKLLRDYRRLEREKAELEQEFAAFRREVRLSQSGSGNLAVVREVRTLKGVVRNLEEQLLKEKTRYQRSTSKRSQEYRDLLEEVEELRASERSLRVRVKSLTNELAMYKRGRPTTRANSVGSRQGSADRLNSSGRNASGSRHRSLSNDRGQSSSRPGSRDTSRERRLGLPQGSTLRRTNSSEQLSARARSRSFDRSNNSGNRSNLSCGAGSNRSRTPSPAGRRFNPTAYVKEKERRQREASLKKKREQRSSLTGLSSRSRQSPNSSRNSGYSSRLFRDNSIGSNGNLSDGYGSDGSYISRARHNSGGSTRGRNPASVENSPSGPPSRTKSNRPPSGKALTQRPINSTDRPHSKQQSKARPVDSGDEGDSDYFDRSAEISEIDERLDRLQQLMKVAMP